MLAPGHIWGPAVAAAAGEVVAVAAAGEVLAVATPQQRRKRGRPRCSPRRKRGRYSAAVAAAGEVVAVATPQQLLNASDSWIMSMPLTHDSSLAAMRKH